MLNTLRRDKTHVHYKTLRELIPPFIFMYLNIPEILFDTTILKTYLQEIPDHVHYSDYARSVFHTVITCLLQLPSPITTCIINKTTSKHDYDKLFHLFNQSLSTYRRLTFPLALLLGPLYTTIRSNQLFNLARSLPISIPLAKHVYCAFTPKLAICIHSDKVISITLAHHIKKLTTFHLDHLSVISLSSFPLFRPSAQRSPTYMKDCFHQELIPVALAINCVYPALTLKHTELRSNAIAFSRFSPGNSLAIYSAKTLPLSTFTMALTIAFPVIRSPLLHEDIPIDILRHSQISFIPLIEDRSDTIYFLTIRLNVSSLLNEVRQIYNELVEEEDTTIQTSAFFSLPREIQDQIIINICASPPTACACQSDVSSSTTRTTRYSTSDYVLTPVYQKDFHSPNYARILFNLYHFKDRRHTPDVPLLATHTQPFDCTPTTEFQCKCHFRHSSPNHDGPHLESAPSYLKKFLNRNDPSHDDYITKTRPCLCN